VIAPRVTKWFVWAFVLALGLGACGKKDDTAAGSGETIVRIGSVAPLTGPQATLGKDNDNGARLALEEINAGGVTLGGKKVKFELMSEDDQADPRTATIVAQKLVDQRVAGVLGHLNSGTTIPASKVYSDAGIPQISPSATAIAYTAQGYKTTFRVMTNDRQQGKVLGEYAVKKLGAKRIAIIDDRTAYGQGLAEQVEMAAKAAGGEIVAHEYTTDRSTDFTSILTVIKSKRPQVLFFAGMYPQAVPMVKQMHGLELKAQFLGGDGVQTADFIKLAGADADGVIASSPGLPIDDMPGGKAFKEKFTAKYGTIQNYAPYAYDAAWAMVDAMKLADSADPAKYLPRLSEVKFTGVTGPISFDGKGDIREGAITLYQCRNGQWKVQETVMGGATADKK
jgi:branched-chain amino acid transport system substrate-binding protein